MSRFATHRTFDQPLYLVIRDFGKIGLESVSDPSDTRETIIRDIYSQQIDRVVSVIEIVDGQASDITEIIRTEVEARLLEAA